jgi:rsbT co-antagonist protein RsbR
VIQFAIVCLIIIGVTVLTTLVSARSWHERSARLYCATSVLLLIISISSYSQSIFNQSSDIYVWRVIFVCALAAFAGALLGLLSALFMPAWWEGKQPIRWIGAPYILFTIILWLDLTFRAGFFVRGIAVTAERVTFNTTDAGWILLTIYTLSWLPHLGLLIVAAVRNTVFRTLIAIQFGAIMLTLVIVFILQRFGLPSSISGALLLIPIPVALAYAVIHTRLTNPIQAATGLALQTMQDAVLVLDPKGQILFRNPAATQLGFQQGYAFAEALAMLHVPSNQAAQLLAITSAPQAVTIGQQRLTMSTAVLRDTTGQIQGTLVLGHNITDLEQRTIQLEQERSQLQTALQTLASEQHERQQLAETLNQATLPLIPVLPGILVVPLIGTLDTQRIGTLQQTLLGGIKPGVTRLILLDITGLTLLDQHGARGLSNMIDTARLLGAECILVGVRPEIAQSLVAQGVPVNLRSAATLQDAVLAEVQLRS